MRIVVSISSDIGSALALDWLDSGHKVWGTYRTWNKNCDLLQDLGAQLEYCNVNDSISIGNAMDALAGLPDWDTLVLSVGDQNPIGLFADINFREWRNSININLVGQLEILHTLMQIPQKTEEVRTVIMFAGGATNRATDRYSAYTISKIASIKICELLDFEYPDYKFSCIGPGWVETKIHAATIKAGTKAGANYDKTKEMLKEGLTNPISNVVEHCNWIIQSSKSVVGGRNFSTVNDSWRHSKLETWLRENPEAYKLRRLGNDHQI